jgi:hypothetical protein
MVHLHYVFGEIAIRGVGHRTPPESRDLFLFFVVLYPRVFGARIAFPDCEARFDHELVVLLAVLLIFDENVIDLDVCQ